MFGDDTNLFYSDKSIHQWANEELNKNKDWFKANKLSLNNKKTVYTLFHKKPNKDDLPLKSPDRKIKNSQVQRKKSIKFPGVMLDENLDWQKHIRKIEKKNKKQKKVRILVCSIEPTI